MAIVTYPLNRIEYQATDAELFHSTRTSGIYASTDFNCSVTGANNIVTVGLGIAWIKNSQFSGKVVANKSNVSVDLGIANASLPRWDVVCIQFDKNENATDIIAKTGTPASSPVLPAIVQTETLYELYLCKIYRPAGAATISAADVYDLRLDPTVCGIMADSVTSVDTTAINRQITELIENIRAELASVETMSGVMLKSIYDTDNDNVVDDAAKLGGHSPEYFATSAELDAIDWTLPGTAIATNTDLNVFTAPGKYFAKSTAIVSTLINCPTKANFSLFVFRRTATKAITQVIIDLNGEIFVRSAPESGTLPTKWAEKATKPVLLWENASPESIFEPQTVAVALSSYSRIGIEFVFKCDVLNYLYAEAEVGRDSALMSMDAAQLVIRSFESYSTGVEFFTGHSYRASDLTETTVNKACVPVKIYGIR